MDVLVKDDANAKRMYVHEVFIRNRLQEPAFKTGAVAAESTGKRARAGDGAIASVLKRIFSVKRGCYTPSPTSCESQNGHREGCQEAAGLRGERCAAVADTGDRRTA